MLDISLFPESSHNCKEIYMIFEKSVNAGYFFGFGILNISKAFLVTES